VIVFGYLAKNNLHWLWLSSLMLVLQWFTDCFMVRSVGTETRAFQSGDFLWITAAGLCFYGLYFIGYSFLLTVFLAIYFPADWRVRHVYGKFVSFVRSNGEFKITYLGTARRKSASGLLYLIQF
jgi:hypothetical protein